MSTLSYSFWMLDADILDAIADAGLLASVGLAVDSGYCLECQALTSLTVDGYCLACAGDLDNGGNSHAA